MSYISRNALIYSILNEDLALGEPTSPRKRSDFISSANDKDPNAEGARKSKGGQSKKALAAGTLIFRPPTNNEIVAAGDYANVNLRADPQTNQIRVLSKVLSDFGLLDKIYRSKKDDWNSGKVNSKETKKALQNIERFLNSKKYSPDTPTEVLAEDLQNSTTALEEELGVRIPEVIGAFDKWTDIMKFDPKTVSDEFPKGYNPRLMANISKVAGSNYKDVYKRVNEHLIKVVLSNKFDSPKKYAKYVAKNESIRAILNEPVVKKYVDRAFSTNDVQDLEEFVLYLKKNLTKNEISSKKGNTMTIMHHIATERIRYVDLMMKRRGFENGIRDFGEMIDYMAEYESDTLKYICHTYEVTPEQLRSFNSYSEFCDWLFGDPARLYSIIDNIPLSDRGKSKGEARRGVVGGEIAKKMKQEQKLRDQLENGEIGSGGKRGRRGKTRAELEDEINELEHAYEELTADLKAMKDEKGSDEYNRIKNLRVKTGREISAKKHALKKRPADEEPRRTLQDDIEKYRSEREALIRREEERLKGDELVAFRDKHNIDKTRQKMGDFDIGSGYVKMSFTFNLNSREDTDIADYIVDDYLEYLNKEEQKNGKEGTINFAWEPGTYEKGLRNYPCTQIIVDYSKSTYLYKKMKMAKDKQERIVIVSKIIHGVIEAVAKRFGVHLSMISDDPKWKVEMMAKSDLSYSFN